MIVICPSCQTRYRQPSEAVMASAMAECSRCDERFRLAPARRTYVLREAGEGVATAIGTAAEVFAAPLESAVGHAVPGAFNEDPGGAPAVPSVEWTGDAVDDPVADTDSPKAAPGSSALVEFLIAVLPSVAGAGLAYDLAGRQNEDPITWAALGGAVGLLLGWACLLWIARKD